MRVLFRREAEIEALAAGNRYEGLVPGLGIEFARALDSIVRTIVESPIAFPVVEADCRRALMRRFPYSVIYRCIDEGILIVAVFHHRREPGEWSQRAGE